FLTRASELGQRDAVNINNSRVLSKAVASGGSSFITKIIIVVAGALFGIAAGSGLAVLREIVGRLLAGGRTRAQSPAPAVAENSDEEEATTARLPILAYIPTQGWKSRVFG